MKHHVTNFVVREYASDAHEPARVEQGQRRELAQFVGK